MAQSMIPTISSIVPTVAQNVCPVITLPVTRPTPWRVHSPPSRISTIPTPSRIQRMPAPPWLFMVIPHPRCYLLVRDECLVDSFVFGIARGFPALPTHQRLGQYADPRLSWRQIY